MSIESGDVVRATEVSQYIFVIVTAASAGAQRSSSEPLWRALAVFRFASVAYAALRLAFVDRPDYDEPNAE